MGETQQLLLCLNKVAFEGHGGSVEMPTRRLHGYTKPIQWGSAYEWLGTADLV